MNLVLKKEILNINMYDPKSSVATDFIDHGEILSSMEYAAASAADRSLEIGRASCRERV